ncbi:hypothetical protein ACHAWF_001066, partial [Thalassiosira exigua]
ICLDGDADDERKPIVRDCSCRGDDAGYAHLSCLVHYAETKTKESLLQQRDLMDIMELWETCPNCHQKYQRQVALDMAKSFISVIDEKFPGGHISTSTLCGLNMVLNTIQGMDYGQHPTLREEGKHAAKKIISVIQASGGDEFAIFTFSEVENTKDRFEMSLYYYEKLRGWHESRGDEMKAKDITARIKEIKSRRDGGSEGWDIDRDLETLRKSYAEHVKKYSEDSSETLLVGRTLVKLLWGSGLHGLECDRLVTNLLTTSQRVHGLEHPLTKELEDLLLRCRIREVGIESASGVREYQMLRFDEAEDKYIVKGQISFPRVPHKEQIRKVAIKDIRIGIRTPVACHGLKRQLI